MEKIHDSQVCKPHEKKKCCMLVDVGVGSKLVGVFDILECLLCLLAMLRIVNFNSYIAKLIPNTDGSIDSSFRTMYWLGFFIFLWRSAVFIKYMIGPSAEHAKAWYHARTVSWAILVVILALYSVYILVKAGFVAFLIVAIDFVIEMSIDLHWCKTIQVFHEDM